MIYNCCNEKRRAAILGNPNVNGLDFLEVLDQDAIALDSPRQQTLLVHCLHPLTALTSVNVSIEGGESVTDISVQWIAQASAAPSPPATSTEQAYFAALTDAANVLVVRTNKPGNFATYTLRLVNDSKQAQQDPFEITETLSGFDPQMAEIAFSFKVECGPDFDCLAQPADCPPPAVMPPPINYLAKDYGSFRTVMLDRMNQLLPNWNATSEADLGVALAELIAYAGDQLSYRQDAIATEAYLETARSRVSLRRHALLVDYPVHDGCNARVWVQLQVSAGVTGPLLLDRNHAVFCNYAPGMPAVLANNETAAFLAGAQLFQPMHDAVLYYDHNQMSFYTWGDTDCCLPAGATEATLAGTYADLRAGDVLIFKEVVGPRTGNAGDADIRRRCAVRLTRVATANSRGQTLIDPLFGQALTQIQWGSSDALPFPICISSSFTDPTTGTPKNLNDVSVALGNVVLADHGYSITGVSLGTVPAPRLYYAANPSADRCSSSMPIPVPVRFRPAIPDNPLTQAVSLPLTPLAGSPVTSGAVALPAAGPLTLTDSSGIASVQVQPIDPATWPQNFGVVAKANGANFDLAVVYNAAQPVVVESLTNLSLHQGDPNFVTTRINGASKLISVPASYSPPAKSPSGFPTGVAMLPNTGAAGVEDTNGAEYLTVQATDPGAWVPWFGVSAQPNQSEAGDFNLAVVYNPPTGGVGVTLPVTLEQFNNIPLASAATEFSSDSGLISVETFAEPDAGLSASGLMSFSASDAVPEISLLGTLNGLTTTWMPRQDLLEEQATSASFVVEVESNGAATVRFGDDTNGKNPETGVSFVASYRAGNGTAGNLGAESLIFVAAPGINACTNPLPAAGGVDPETNDQIRRRAPRAFQTQERAVTVPDYAAAAESSSQIDRAVATLRWTGSWYTAFVAAEPVGGGNLSASLEKTLENNIGQYRLAGQDLQLQSPQYVSLEIELQVVVSPNYFQAHVEQSLLAVLGSGILPNGQHGLFYPDTFTFGQTVYLSPLYAAARSVAGVASVSATRFQPQGVNTNQFLSAGEIKLGAFQVARLDNDPSFPDHGRLTLVMTGGK